MTQRNFFIDKRESLKPVNLRNLSMVPSGTKFLNSMFSVDSVSTWIPIYREKNGTANNQSFWYTDL